MKLNFSFLNFIRQKTATKSLNPIKDIDISKGNIIVGNSIFYNDLDEKDDDEDVNNLLLQIEDEISIQTFRSSETVV
jgi:hypothetical protein